LIFMSDAQKTPKMLPLKDILDAPTINAGAGRLAEGESIGAKAVATEGLEAAETITGVEGLGAVLGPIGLTGMVAKQVYNQAEENLKATEQESDAQDYANGSIYESTKDTSDIDKTRTMEAVKQFNFDLKQAGYKEGPVSGVADEATNVANLKTIADKAIGDAFASEDMDTRLTRAFERAKKDAAPDSPLSEAADEAYAQLIKAQALPNDETTEDGYSVHNFEKDRQVAEWQDKLATAQNDVKQNNDLKAALEKKLDRATEETAEARVRMNEAEDAVRTALKNATNPAGDAASATFPGQGGAVQQTPALQQLLQQQNSANKTLNSLLEANHKSGEEQSRLLQNIIDNQTKFQSQLDMFRAQLRNLSSVGMH
jgi:hypothetical protein